MKVNLLAFGAHPDDVELGCGGTLLVHIDKGERAGIVDLTRGELGTRGSKRVRDEEARRAAKILGVQVRENLNFEDGFFRDDRERRLTLIAILRKYRPDIVLSPATGDRHPDHGCAAQLISAACFLSGLHRIKTRGKEGAQQPWRPRALYQYLQFREKTPHILVDISRFHERKMEAVRAYRSQFHDPSSAEPQTVLSSPDFLETVTARARQLGLQTGVKYAEGFTAERLIGVRDLSALI